MLTRSRITFKAMVHLLTETVKSWNNHHAPKMGAALSYYTAFSLAPLVVLILSIASLIFRKDYAREEIIHQFTDLIGPQGGATVKEILDHAATTHSGTWGAVVSFVILLFGASGAFGELQDSLNQIWEVTPDKRPFFSMIKDRALSFVMVFILGFFMLTSLILSALIAGLSRLLVHQFPVIGLELANTVLSFVIISGLFATIFRILPSASLTWRDVLPGAVFSAALFIIGKFLLGWYIGHSTTFSAYGTAGSFVVILLWVFYSAQILFLGAEFTRAYTKKHGSHRHQPSSASPPVKS